jgi:hypothetical protein
MAAGGYQGSLVIKGTSTGNTTISASTFDRAHFVRIQTTAANNTITLKEGSTILGTLVLHDAGDSIVIEKKPAQTIETSGNAFGSAVGSPR